MHRIHTLVPFLMIKFSRFEMETSHYLYQNFNFSCRGTATSLSEIPDAFSGAMTCIKLKQEERRKKSLTHRVLLILCGITVIEIATVIN